MAVTPWKLISLTMTYLAVRCLATSDVTISNWRRLTPYNVTTFEVTVEGRSKVECMRECLKYTHCSRVAFQSTTSTCFLQPHQPQSESSGNDVVIYDNKEAICSPDDAPVYNATVTWYRTLTSFAGNVTCDENFMWTSSNGLVACDADNKWQISGACVQHKWTSITTNGSVKLSVPVPVTVGWKMCFRGVQATGAERIWWELYDIYRNRPMKMLFTFSVDGVWKGETKFNSHVNDSFVNPEVVTTRPFPLTESVPFYIEAHAVSLFQLDVYVDNQFFYSYTTTLPVTSVIKVKFSYMDLQFVDLWCGS